MRAPWDEPNALPDDALKNRQGRQGRRMTDSGGQRYFDDPIQLPDGRTLVTLHDAATLGYRKRTPQSRNGWRPSRR